MPIYQFKCSSCGNMVEKLSYSTDAVCPLCSQCGQLMTMVYGDFSMRFKGSGFYETDYKRKNDVQSSE